MRLPAISLYRQALDIWRDLADGDEIVAVRLHRKIVQMATEAKWNIDLENYRQASQIALESRSSLEQSLGVLQGEPAHPELVRALATLSFDAWRNQVPPDWERAQRFAQQAVDMAERLNDPVVLSRALGALANVLDGRSLLRQHLQVAQRRLEISKDARLADPGVEIDALSGIGMALMYVGEYAQAMPHLQEAETLATSVQAIALLRIPNSEFKSRPQPSTFYLPASLAPIACANRAAPSAPAIWGSHWG